MTEHLAPVIDIRTRRRIDHLRPVEPSHDEMTPAMRSQLWADLEFHERMVEGCRRKLGLLAVEKGISEREEES